MMFYTRTCCECKTQKLLNCFHKDKTTSSGYCSSCKVCKNKKARLRYKNKRPALLKKMHNYKQEKKSELLKKAHWYLYLMILSGQQEKMKDGYTRIYFEGFRALLHRLYFCYYHSFSLGDIEYLEIHHINKCKEDNTIENLKALPVGVHQSLEH